MSKFSTYLKNSKDLIDIADLPRKEVGQEVTEVVSSVCQDFLMNGIVVYVHSENRYYTVAFPYKGGHSFKESYIVR